MSDSTEPARGADALLRARRTRVVVVGGGVAGLVSALEWAKIGAQVTVLDAAGRLGGSLETALLDERAKIDACRASADAGADSLYPVAFHDAATLRHLADALPLPVNAIANPATDDLAALAAAGAGRISFGPIWQMALTERSNELLARWR